MYQAHCIVSSKRTLAIILMCKEIKSIMLKVINDSLIQL